MITNPLYGAGPSHAPTCPNPSTHVWIEGAWRLVQQQPDPQPDANRVPNPPLDLLPSRTLRAPLAPRAGTPAGNGTQRRPFIGGLYAILFGPRRLDVLTNDGAPLRMKLGLTGRRYNSESNGEGVTTALQALAMGKLQWLHDTADSSETNTKHIARVRLASIPAAYQAALKTNRTAVARALRQEPAPARTTADRDHCKPLPCPCHPRAGRWRDIRP